jgi:hypothetical protein
MAYASRAGRARVSAKKPEAQARCDRCSFWYNWVDLKWQYDWRGPTLANIRILVCNRCYDVPQENLRAIVLPADPVPIINARPEQFDESRSNYRSLSAPTVLDPKTGIPIPNKTLRITEDNQNRAINPFGIPVGLTQAAVMPYDGAVQKAYGVALAVLSVQADDSATVTVTCSKVHNLQNNDQVSIEGLNFAPACGFYSVAVTTATAFTYMTYGSNPAGSLLTSETLIITCIVGLPSTRPEVGTP